MNVISGILALISVVGTVIAIYGLRKKRRLSAHDLNKDSRNGVRAEGHPLHFTVQQSGPHNF